MKAQGATVRILVASDNLDDAALIVRQLKGEFAETRASTDPNKTVEDFEAFEPDVLILAFDSIQKAQGHLLALYRFSERVSARGHKTILLCHKDEVRTAYDLCKRGSFDDYVLHWPQAQDGLRLSMSVWCAARQLVASPGGGPGHVELVSHVRQLGEMQALVEAQAADGQRHAASADGSLKQAERAVGVAIDDLLRRLSGNGANGIIDVRDRAGLTREVEQLKNSRISQTFIDTAKAVAPATSGMQKLREAMAPRLDGLLTIGGKLSKAEPLVMVIDDDDFACKLTQKALEGAGYELVFAHDGAAALGLLRRRRPDLILMDVNLPDIDGVALTQKLKRVPQYADIPVLMLTGEARREILAISMSAGAAGFIVKPFTRDALVAKLDRLLSTPAVP